MRGCSERSASRTAKIPSRRLIPIFQPDFQVFMACGDRIITIEVEYDAVGGKCCSPSSRPCAPGRTDSPCLLVSRMDVAGGPAVDWAAPVPWRLKGPQGERDCSAPGRKRGGNFVTMKKKQHPAKEGRCPITAGKWANPVFFRVSG